ncbi:MAG TPA: hypothetical protein VGA61_18085 [Anaerolineae bacterium]
MAFHPDLSDVADLLGLSGREAGEYCSEVAWHVSDRQITYRAIAEVLEAHPHVDPEPELVAHWIMASPPGPDDSEAEDYVDLEFDPRRGKLNIIQKRDFRDAQAGFRKCPHGIPITQRCRICHPND